ncbi:SDR family NAD(P)-dependent oxidoreductase [Roseomonas terrae]|jgi:NAD(P)-dependent dehydrogenase (short-subunit alcohol dehydrogenase family)|uniref:SDR family NAD(P)-dependent oxidoreductase n=1 Tax=Neoroseomonas terrae TaxID=424799 RepID=A0ABS5EJW7_9PROT|nr:SDR family NAD(P)-dependent oxidoreductase [Neoroseomonas terrae]MBR0651317.1 SDR family NAD(P)-dependent oxidoreductase [Neoroseomonas terrae]
MQLNGAAALVTGAGSGLGAATAEALAAAGAHVVAMDLNADGLAALASRCDATPIAGDVTSETDVAGALEAAGGLGPLRLVVNCAGIAPAARVVGRNGAHDLALFERTLRINLVGTFNVLRLAAQRMQRLEPTAPDHERGVIVNTASIAAEDGQVGQCAYAASKAGVMGLTLPAARELAKSGIRVVTIAPGLFETPMLAGLPDAAQAAIRALPPFPARLGKPAEFAAMVLAICANPLLNGTTIRVDSALRLPP